MYIKIKISQSQSPKTASSWSKPVFQGQGQIPGKSQGRAKIPRKSQGRGQIFETVLVVEHKSHLNGPYLG